MKSLFLICVISVLSLGCSDTQIHEDLLQLRQGKYYFQRSSTPYTGKVVSKFDDGNISSIIDVKQGIPNGKWIAYGYQKEIVQEGSYTPIDLSAEPDFFQEGIYRLNVCVTREGGFEFTEILLLTETPGKKDTTKETVRILNVLKKHAIQLKGDTISKIKYVTGELEDN